MSVKVIQWATARNCQFELHGCHQVRVSRKRILESAIKVMDLYAGSRSVLELEYFGEAGTGLGPTLEFYTLLSYELQRKGLGMWRSDPATHRGSDSSSDGQGMGCLHRSPHFLARNSMCCFLIHCSDAQPA